MLTLCVRVLAVNWDALGAIAELVGAIAVLATLIYLTLQIRQNSRALEKSNIHAQSDSIHNVNRLHHEVFSVLSTDAELAARFAPVAKALSDNEDAIIAELASAQGEPVDIGGYFHPNVDMAVAAMRPSATLNNIIDSV